MSPKIVYGPWPTLAAARSFLSLLVKGTPLPSAALDPAVDRLAPRPPLSERPIAQWSIAQWPIAQWLMAHELGPLAYVRFQGLWPELGHALQADWYAAAAENQLHQENFNQIASAFAQQQIPLLVLKGAALAQTVYPDAACRPMSDVDLWVAPDRMDEAVAVMQRLGFDLLEKAERPTKLQLLSGGEIRFGRPDWVQGLVELHWSALAGWWLYHTAAVDMEGLWQRRVPLLTPVAETDTAVLAYQLDPEDTIIQLAVHIAVNHQFSGTLLRSLADIALTAVSRPINWQLLADRAKRWRVGTAVYCTLSLTHHLFDLPASEPARRQLRPPRLRRRLLGRLINPRKALNRADIRTSLARQLLLLLLVDRPRDRVRLIGRTLWPTAAWREARYGRPTSPFRHFWHVFRHWKI
jgi:hypothetical protein